MWEIITHNEEDMKENMVSDYVCTCMPIITPYYFIQVENSNTATTSTKKHVPQGVEFCALYSDLPSKLSTQMTKSLSIPICFVCLLHLANEKVHTINNERHNPFFLGVQIYTIPPMHNTPHDFQLQLNLLVALLHTVVNRIQRIIQFNTISANSYNRWSD